MIQAGIQNGSVCLGSKFSDNLEMHFFILHPKLKNLICHGEHVRQDSLQIFQSAKFMKNKFVIWENNCSCPYP